MKLGSYLFRRGLHLANALFFLYYLIPDDMLIVTKKFYLVLIFAFIPLLLEIRRLRAKRVLFGQRDHESNTLGAYAWSLWASTIIILVLPQVIAVPVIMVYAFGDPLIGEIRLWRKNLVLPLGFLVIFFMFLVFRYNILLAGVGAIFMVIGEAVEMVGEVRIRPELLQFYGERIKIDLSRIIFKTDDDGTTQIVPAIALGLFYIYWPGIFPEPLFHPLF